MKHAAEHFVDGALAHWERESLVELGRALDRLTGHPVLVGFLETPPGADMALRRAERPCEAPAASGWCEGSPHGPERV